MPAYMDHQSKRAIRNNWCRPLIRFVYEQLDCKLVYLGLPSPEANDVLSWIDYLDSVIAFQCRDYPNPSSVEQPREQVIVLENKLMDLERRGLLSSFALYDGYIEEVLIRGRDTRGEPFVQENLVTVYNLDFCNSITAPLTYVDQQAHVRTAFKSQAIRELLVWQRRFSANPLGKFIMFLTIHSNFFPDEEARYLRHQWDEEIARYLRKVNRSLTGLERQLRVLRAYVYQILRDFFCTSEFTPELLPTIYYRGAGGNWLVHFTIIGSMNPNPSGRAPCDQSAESFLNQRFLNIGTNNSFNSRVTNGIVESAPPRNSIEAFTNSSVFTTLWRRT